jgi:hypothetical protein
MAKKTAKRVAKQTAKKTVKKSTKKVVKKSTKNVAKKATKNVAKKATKNVVTRTSKPAASSKQTRSTSIAAIAPIGEGDAWELMMEDGSSMRVNAAAAQVIGLGVSAPWNASVATKLAAAEDDQRAFTAAMQLLAKAKTAWTKASLLKKLGGDARAKRTVAALAESGWVR